MSRKSPTPTTLLTPLTSVLVLIALLIVIPLVLPMALAIDIVIYSIAALAFSLMLGQAGMLSFGQAAFFALGAYTAGYLLKQYGVTAVPALVAAAVMGGAGAALVAVLTGRLRDVYFVLMTLAFAQLVYFLAITWRTVTGGPSGLTGIPRPTLSLGLTQVDLTSSTSFYVFASVVLLLVFICFYSILLSPVGLILRGIKDNPDRLEAIGYSVWQYRLFTFTVSGALTGLAGALYAFQWQLVPASKAGMSESAAIAFMSILGGVTAPLGPVVGAAIYIWLSDIVSTYWARWPIAFGAFIIFIIFFLRGGIMQGIEMATKMLTGRPHTRS
jgi:branched-chain amino acid transport system permease protein